ncbi:MAG TPA: hypothetical protein VI248_26330 [Kineosporiaceae bacterium]
MSGGHQVVPDPPTKGYYPVASVLVVAWVTAGLGTVSGRAAAVVSPVTLCDVA